MIELHLTDRLTPPSFVSTHPILFMSDYKWDDTMKHGYGFAVAVFQTNNKCVVECWDIEHTDGESAFLDSRIRPLSAYLSDDNPENERLRYEVSASCRDMQLM